MRFELWIKIHGQNRNPFVCQHVSQMEHKSGLPHSTFVVEKPNRGHHRDWQFGCMFGGMPKMQVYLPDDLYAQVKAQGQNFNVSGILQQALQQRIDHENRLAAGREAIADYEADFGVFTETELAEQAKLDLENSVFPQAKRKRPQAA